MQTLQSAHPLPAPTVTAGGLLIGGHALRLLGSSRYTEDVDYLINDPASPQPFLHDAAQNIDYVNANGHKFFADVWRAEAGNTSGRATPQTLLELKAFALVQHYQNRAFQKADDTEFDIKFLVRATGVRTVKLVAKYVTAGQLAEISQVIASTRI